MRFSPSNKFKFTRRHIEAKGFFKDASIQYVKNKLYKYNKNNVAVLDYVLYYIKGRRSNGSFTLVSLEGLKDEDRTYKKLTLLAHTNAYLIKLKEKN